ncbi:sugar transferase [Halogranum rubrum]|uniref:Exopolysaccharide biosynthesis polyprenyl glycosylphosphotransferase n=1 Tax=Halogranum salarium B-1 TaxID=1210908 RepID=J3JDZ3_9EURY|nr:sugar transferase [Halogranum salarium]EJN57914.1 exopolysaccharide biosynthesis polyprenyl glycosylphosphotransferase [Halogranum salarium B-1]
MQSGYRYRIASVLGTILLTLFSVLLVNQPTVQTTVTTLVPVIRRLPAIVLADGELQLALVTTVAVVLGSLVPLFKPRPRRILDTILFAQKRILVAGATLAGIGYFDYTYRLPRSTLALSILGLLVVLPVWFVAIRRRPTGRERAVIIGDDPEEIADVLDAIDIPVIGYVSPPSPYYSEREDTVVSTPTVADGSGNTLLQNLDCLGGLSRLDEVLVEYDIDTAILAFAQPDRAEFFGALDTCYEHGVDARVHRDHTNDVLTRYSSSDEKIVDIDLEPWDWQDYVFKRLFDVLFAGVGLLLLAPVVLAVAVAIKLDSAGPVFYSQKRTAEFGETFEIYKFRSMVTDAEAETGATISEEDAGGFDPRVTKVGRFLRQTHLDEIPQLWSILVGDMSVVGPRPERPELDADIRIGVVEWRKRWFVKPGLTGLAQINGATGHRPAEKLRYDVEYIQRQSFWFDVKIVLRQVWSVLTDLRRVGDD